MLYIVEGHTFFTTATHRPLTPNQRILPARSPDPSGDPPSRLRITGFQPVERRYPAVSNGTPFETTAQRPPLTNHFQKQA